MIDLIGNYSRIYPWSLAVIRTPNLLRRLEMERRSVYKKDSG